MVLIIDFNESHNPHHIEKCLRDAVGKKILPKFNYLMVGVDYKNLKVVNIPRVPQHEKK